jgi:hypothetical protein
MNSKLAAFLVALVVAMSAVGCSAASVVSPTPAAPDAPITAAPSQAGDGVVGGGGGGLPAQPGQPALLVPKPGQLNVHDVGIDELTARVAGRHVVLNAHWASGVEPCNVFDSVAVTRDATKITVAIREGSSADVTQRGVACIEIAMLKVTAIDLGDLEPGAYTIAASEGTAPPIEVTVD